MKGTPEAGKSAVAGVVLEPNATLEEVKTYLSEFRHGEAHYLIESTTFGDPSINQYWQGAGGPIGVLVGAFTTMLTTEARLIDSKPPPNIDLAKQQKEHPFQRMFADRHLELRISDIVSKAFGTDLVIDRGAGNVIPAFIGKRPKPAKGEERIDPSYCAKVRALQRLEDQGDGVKSFVSVVARLLTEARPVILIDEPEAFLHPPQARLVGRQIAAGQRTYQTFVATHSSDVLQGLLTENPSNTTVVRLSRVKGGTAHPLLSADIKELWGDPLLRFSRALDGLFHDGVIIAEDGSDCQFYDALIDTTAQGDRKPDLHFAHANGKDKIHVLVRALAKIAVPVAAIVDLDILSREEPLRKIFEALGGRWSDIEARWRAVKEGVEADADGSYLNADRFKAAIQEQLNRCIPGDAVPTDVLRRLRELTKSANPWAQVKRSGLAAFPHGKLRTQANELVAILAKKSLFAVPTGEMEGFCPTIEARKGRFVVEVLRRDFNTDPELSAAREFGGSIRSHLAGSS